MSPCNATLGRLEEDLLWRFGLCVDPAEAAASGIAESVLRSMDPAAAKNEKDRPAEDCRASVFSFNLDRLLGRALEVRQFLRIAIPLAAALAWDRPGWAGGG